MKALLVGSGAYRGRMPSWLYALVRLIAGDRIARVPLDQIDNIGASVKLKCAAETLGLHETEDEVRALIPRVGAM